MIAIVLACFLAIDHDFEGKVVGITDGDTLTILVDRETVKVRLDGIDAPERRQPFGDKAREKLGELTFGKAVTVHSKGKDRYGRTLGTVLAGGESVNLKMVEAGLAWHYKQYSKDATLSRAEYDARKAGRGLWGEKNPVPPWEFRKTPTKKKAA